MFLNIEQAEKEFQSLLYRVEPKSVAEFLSWINESFVVSGDKSILIHLCFLWNSFQLSGKLLSKEFPIYNFSI